MGVFLENGFKGGIHICKTPEEVRDVADMMCGQTLVTPFQKNDIFFETGEQGFLSRCVYVMEKLDTLNKFFIAIRLDREKDCPVISYSKLGGMSYQKIMTEYPEEMMEIHVDFIRNLRMGELLNVASDLGIDS